MEVVSPFHAISVFTAKPVSWIHKYCFPFFRFAPIRVRDSSLDSGISAHSLLSYGESHSSSLLICTAMENVTWRPLEVKEDDGRFQLDNWIEWRTERELNQRVQLKRRESWEKSRSASNLLIYWAKAIVAWRDRRRTAESGDLDKRDFNEYEEISSEIKTTCRLFLNCFRSDTPRPESSHWNTFFFPRSFLFCTLTHQQFIV